MAASLDYPSQFNVHRRPLPTGAQPMDYLTHSRSRTISSNVLPANPYAHHHHQPQQQQQQQQQPQPPPLSSRRTLSNATTSTTSTANSSVHSHGHTHSRAHAAGPPSSYASSIRRSTSSRSNNTPSSYVALMRKQKATVWCDRAQHEDPRILAQQRAAKVRAQQEVVGGVSATGNPGRSNQSSGGGIASKIRHHGAVKASAYSAAGNLSGAGVPMRLSASEVDEDNSDDDASASARYHHRNGSGRSSLNSGHRHSYYSGPTPTATRFSNGSTPPSRHSYSPVEKSTERERQNSAFSYQDETPVQGSTSSMRSDYFSQNGGNGGSGSSEEQRFGDVGGLPGREPVSHSAGGERQRYTSDELRRRGSVDDRTTTMSGVRLFVANPDMDDD